MSRAETEDATIYKVVVNHEEQYSIWPAERETRSVGETRERPVQSRNVSLTSRRYGRT